MSDARPQLLTLLSQLSFRLGQFKLSSGGASDYYIDCRTTTLHAEARASPATSFSTKSNSRNWHPQAIGGLTMGADPIVVSVAMLSAQRSRLVAPNAPLPSNSSTASWSARPKRLTAPDSASKGSAKKVRASSSSMMSAPPGPPPSRPSRPPPSSVFRWWASCAWSSGWNPTAAPRWKRPPAAFPSSPSSPPTKCVPSTCAASSGRYGCPTSATVSRCGSFAFLCHSNEAAGRIASAAAPVYDGSHRPHSVRLAPRSPTQ